MDFTLGGGGGGTETGWGVSGPLPSPIMTKICSFPNPIDDLTKTSATYLWALNLFTAGPLISTPPPPSLPTACPLPISFVFTFVQVCGQEGWGIFAKLIWMSVKLTSWDDYISWARLLESLLKLISNKNWLEVILFLLHRIACVWVGQNWRVIKYKLKMSILIHKTALKVALDPK